LQLLVYVFRRRKFSAPFFCLDFIGFDGSIRSIGRGNVWSALNKPPLITGTSKSPNGGLVFGRVGVEVGTSDDAAAIAAASELAVWDLLGGIIVAWAANLTVGVVEVPVRAWSDGRLVLASTDNGLGVRTREAALKRDTGSRGFAGVIGVEWCAWQRSTSFCNSAMRRFFSSSWDSRSLTARFALATAS
jgi:hypothetical protein